MQLGLVYKDANGALWEVPLRGLADGTLFVDFARLAGERNSASAVESYLDIRTEGRPQLLTGVAATAIGGSVTANDTHLMRIIITTALVGTLTIAGFADTAGVAQNFVLPIGTPAGVYEYGAALNTAGQLLTTLSSATDNNRVMVQTRPR
jgi:hypothetical protein